MKVEIVQSSRISRMLVLGASLAVITTLWVITAPSTAVAAHCGPGPRVHRVHTKHMTCNAADRQIRAYYRKANRPGLPCDNGCRVRRMHCHAGAPTGSGGIKGRCASDHRHVTWVVRVGP